MTINLTYNPELNALHEFGTDEFVGINAESVDFVFQDQSIEDISQKNRMALYLLMHRVANEHPTEEIVITVVGQNPKQFLQFDPQRMPATVTLKLGSFFGATEIKGNGEIDAHYTETIRANDNLSLLVGHSSAYDAQTDTNSFEHQNEIPEQESTSTSSTNSEQRGDSQNGDIGLAKNEKSNDYSMMILGGFIAVLGAAAVAVAFTVLAPITSVGLVLVGGVGVAALLGGLGMFAYGAVKSCGAAPEDSKEMGISEITPLFI